MLINCWDNAVSESFFSTIKHELIHRHDWDACSLAKLGYIGFACDLFGKGIRGAVTGDNSALIAPFLRDRAMLRMRLIGTVEVVRSLPEVDPSKVAAVGFCFGGLCVLDLARAGVDVQAVASFHGLFSKPEGLTTAPIQAKVIAFHGWDDPMVPPAEVVALGEELTEAGADWQIHAYGGTMHAFMAVGANRPEAGIQLRAGWMLRGSRRDGRDRRGVPAPRKRVWLRDHRRRSSRQSKVLPALREAPERCPRTRAQGPDRLQHEAD